MKLKPKFPPLARETLVYFVDLLRSLAISVPFLPLENCRRKLIKPKFTFPSLRREEDKRYL